MQSFPEQKYKHYYDVALSDVNNVYFDQLSMKIKNFEND
jgi:hypothetical protein